MSVDNNVSGFQLTALTPGNQRAGTFEAQSATLAKLSSQGVEYMAHRIPESGPWVIEWTPPLTDVGTVTIYASARRSDNSVVVQTASIAVNQSPTASFSAQPSDGDAPLDVTFDAGASSDPDGSIVSYAWNFGDGDGGAGSMTSHTFAEPGTYQVSLTVTDDNGASDEDTAQITVVAPNQAPTATFTATPESGEAPLQVSFDATSSSDPDGVIVDYSWTFGDGNVDNGPEPEHTFLAAGSYQVRLMVTDDDGANDQFVRVVTVDAANQAPTASFSASPQTGEAPLQVSFDAASSTDSDGSIVEYAWAFGDGTTGTGPLINHTYDSEGSYEATLTVTDDDGASSTQSETIVITAPNQPPSAVFSSSTVSGEVPLEVDFDASGSSDPDGSISTYGWTFGDGGTGTGSMVTHTFTNVGTYEVRLRVTDNDGAVGTATQAVSVNDPANQAPVASFTASPTSGERPLQVAFDAGASSDSDGSITDYAWDFGNGTSASGVARVTRTYTLAGSYEVRLTVTDDDGATAFSTRTITVNDPANQAPVAAFSVIPVSGVAPHRVSVDASESQDPDGVITDFEWDFGDGRAVFGLSAEHTFDLAGTYAVRLTVTDDQGLSASSSRIVEVRQPGSFRVSGVYPNPIRGSGKLVLEVQQQGRYRMRIFNLLGKEVSAGEITSSASGRVEIPIELGTEPGGLFMVLIENMATGQRISSRLVHIW